MKTALTVLAATAAIVFAIPMAANAETIRYYPVNSWVGPVTVSPKTSVTYYSFTIFASSTGDQAQPNPVAISIASCDSTPLNIVKTRHLTNGEKLIPMKGGPGITTAVMWSRMMGVDGPTHPARLSLTFASQAPSFCVEVWDASQYGGGHYTTVYMGMK